MSGAVEQPMSRWDQRPPPKHPWYLAPLVLLILAVLVGDVAGFAQAVNDRVANSVVRDSVRAMGTVTAIHVRDDFVRPSVVELALDQSAAGRRTLSVRTSEEDIYHVGERVPVEVDVRHEGLSAIVGDENGPTWTLGAETLGVVGAGLLAIASAITAIVTGSGAWDRRRPATTFAAPPWATGALPVAARAAPGPVPTGSAPRLAVTDPALRQSIDGWCRGALVGSILRIAAAGAGVALYVWSRSVHPAFARDIWHLVAFVLVAGAGQVSRRALLGRQAMRRWVTAPGQWRPASAQLVRSRWQGGLRIASDADHVQVYGYGLDPIRPFIASPSPDGFPVWVSAGPHGSLAVSDSGGQGLIAAWPIHRNQRWRPVGEARRRWRLRGR